MGIFFPLSLKKFEKPSYLFSLCLPQNLEAESENKQGCQKYIWPICICYTWESLGTVQQLPNHPSHRYFFTSVLQDVGGMLSGFGWVLLFLSFLNTSFELH